MDFVFTVFFCEFCNKFVSLLRRCILSRSFVFFPVISGNHSSLIAKFKLQRRIGYFLIDTYIPSTIIVIISWISFWIDPQTAPARVALGITTVLTMTTLISSARASLPKVSYVKAIDWYLLLCLIFVFGSIMEYTFVTYTQGLHRRLKKRMKAQLDSNGEAFNSSPKVVLSSRAD